MLDDTPENTPLKLNAGALAPIREAAQPILEIPVDDSVGGADWPRLPDESYTPEELSAAYGDESDYDALNETDAEETNDALTEALDSQHAELRQHARQLEELERRLQHPPAESVLS